MTNQNKLTELHQLVETAQASLNGARQVLRDLGVEDIKQGALKEKAKKAGSVAEEGNEKIIEGVFDGQNMVGPDGKRYSVPANYASKSKLVEGDMLKLTITEDGYFVFKQIGPVDRMRLVGTLTSDDTTGDYFVLAGNKSYKMLLASITYFKGEPGDEVVVLVPKEGAPTWAAVENIIKSSEVGAKAQIPDLGPVPASEHVKSEEEAPDDID